MKTLNYKIISGMLLTAMVTLFSLTASAGVGSSGGADYEIKLNAWFTSGSLDTPVHICIQSTPDFGFPDQKLKDMTLKVFNQWGDYARRAGSLVPPMHSCTMNGPPAFRVATVPVMLDHCDGTEDLTVYFGVKNDLITERAKKYSKPYAFSELNNMPLVMSNVRQADWSKGFIWIAPPLSVDLKYKGPLWTNYEGAPLQTVLLHEMGHVFGNSHSDRTIMSADIAHGLNEQTQIARAGRPWSQYDSLALTIDSYHFLVYRPELALKIPMIAADVRMYPNDVGAPAKKKRMQFAYKKLTGVELTTEYFTAVLTHAEKPITDYGVRNYVQQFGTFSLELSGNNATTALSFESISVVSHAMGSPAFKTYCPGGREPQEQRFSIMGKLIRPDGGSSLYILNLNSEMLVELVDPTMGPTDEHCADEYNGTAVCSLLFANYDALRAQNSAPSKK